MSLNYFIQKLTLILKFKKKKKKNRNKDKFLGEIYSNFEIEKVKI